MQDATGRPIIKFGKLLAGRSARQAVLVRNNGVLPAMARLEAEHHDAFSVLEGPQVMSLFGRTNCCAL